LRIHAISARRFTPRTAVMPRRVAPVRVTADASSLFEQAAQEFIGAARKAIESKGRFDVVLSGGSTPKGLFVLLTSDRHRNSVAWGQVRFFWGDERQVPPDDPESNYGMAREALLRHVPVEQEQVFRIPGENPDAAVAASQYEAALRKAFDLVPGSFPRFDLILLGMGPDGHTASLFPGTKALKERHRSVTSNWVGKLFAHRITLTSPVLNAAERVMFLVSGADKAPALKAVMEGPREPVQLPAQLIRPRSGSLLWLADPTAASMLASTHKV
jgi:6-phosphogluconolactonase